MNALLERTFDKVGDRLDIASDWVCDHKDAVEGALETVVRVGCLAGALGAEVVGRSIAEEASGMDARVNRVIAHTTAAGFLACALTFKVDIVDRY